VPACEENDGDDSRAAAGALPGVRVLDCSGPLGAYCTKLLADLGADVIKVEPPDGDQLRHLPPFKAGVAHPEASLWFAYYHQNKRGVTLDLDRREVSGIRARLGTGASVIVVSSEKEARTWLATADQEGPVVCAITPYGLSGPYRHVSATHFTSCAMGGVLITPGDGEVPIPPLDQQMYDLAAAHAALAILVALRNRMTVGPQSVEIAAHEVMAGNGFAMHRFALAGYTNLQTGVAFAPPAGTWACSDGDIRFEVGTARQWEAFLELIGSPAELANPLYEDYIARHGNAEHIRRVVTPLIALQKRDELFARAQALGVPCAPINSVSDFVCDPQTVAREVFAHPVIHPHLGEYPTQQLFRSSQPLAVHRRAAPTLGEHNEDVFIDELGYGRDDVLEWSRSGLI
jgi:crotonobetainyl-CoA:carnitine CoA-transferase CaiB-like acyl-CoA transferase